MKKETKRDESVFPRTLSRKLLGMGFVVSALMLVLSSVAEIPGDVFKIGDGEEPTVATDTDGTAVVLWEADTGAGTVEVRGRGFDNLGMPLGFEFGLTSAAAATTQTASSERNPAAVFLPEDEFFVAWESFDGTQSAVMGRRFASTASLGDFGMPLGFEFQVSTAASRELEPAVGADDSGNITVVWAGPLSWLPHLPLRLNHVRRFDSLGKPLGFEVQFGFSGEDSPAVAVRPQGEFLVIWENPARNIRGQAFDSLGKPLGFIFQVNQPGPGRDYAPSVTTALDGDYTVVWEREVPGRGQERLVYGRRVSAAGKPLGFEFLVSSTPSGVATRPAVAADQHGNTLATWRCLDDSGIHDDGIFVRRIDLQGKPLGFEYNIAESSQVGYSKVSRGGQDADFLVVWEGIDEGATATSAGPSIFGRCLQLDP